MRETTGSDVSNSVSLPLSFSWTRNLCRCEIQNQACYATMPGAWSREPELSYQCVRVVTVPILEDHLKMQKESRFFKKIKYLYSFSPSLPSKEIKISYSKCIRCHSQISTGEHRFRNACIKALIGTITVSCTPHEPPWWKELSQ